MFPLGLRVERMFHRLIKRKSCTPRRYRKLGLEILEERRLLAADFMSQYTTANGVVLNNAIVIQGTALADTVQVTRDGGDVVVDLYSTRANGTVDHEDENFNRNGVQWIVFEGLDGTNQFTNLTDVGSYAFGGAGTDKFTGGSATDFFYAYGGNDVLAGAGGDDMLNGDTGSDTYKFIGNTLGADTIQESNVAGETDTLDFSGFTAPFAKEFTSPSVHDYSVVDLSSTRQQTVFVGHLQLTLPERSIENVVGTEGADVIFGNALDNRLWGGGGMDLLDGAGGVDRIWGGIGNDDIYGGDDNDFLYGEADHDALCGGRGSDQLEGGTGRDLLLGDYDIARPFRSSTGATDDSGVDQLARAWVDAIRSGSSSTALEYDILLRTIFESTPSGSEFLRGMEAEEVSEFDFKYADTLSGGEGNDVLYGAQGFDTIYCGGGDDWAFAGGGGGYVYGEAGNDILYGGRGVDRLYGGADLDNLYGGESGDYLYGEAGRDVLYGENGNDWLYGGADSDWLFGQDGLDNLYGDAGRDWLDPGHDSYVDVVDGGADSDNDTFVRHYRRVFLPNGQHVDVYDAADTYLNFTIGLDTVFTRRED